MSETLEMPLPTVDLDWSADMEIKASIVEDNGQPQKHFQIDLGEHGFVRLEDVMGHDLRPVNAAKVSFADRSISMGDREKGISAFLMRERHGSPFEHAVIQFTMRAPLFVLYEWHRHRAGHSYNEESARYTTMRSDFQTYEPEQITTQTGKPGSYEFTPMYHLDGVDSNGMTPAEHAVEASSIIELTQRFAFREYNRLLKMGVSKQQARVVLPVGMFKEQMWTCNLRSLMHFLGLRMDKNAQEDIRWYAHAVYRLASHAFPITMEQFTKRGFVAP